MPKSQGKRKQQVTAVVEKPRKKAKAQPQPEPKSAPQLATDVSSSSGDSSGAEDSEATSMSSTAECELEFFDPQDKDWTGLQALLQQYLDGREWRCGELVDAIIQQRTVGTVIKADEEEDAVGVASVLSTARHGGLESLKQVQSFIFDHCPKGRLTEQFLQAWQGCHTGLLINERVINCPPEIGPPSQQALFDEIAWATEDEPQAEDKDMFKFDMYLLMARCYGDNSAPLTADPAPVTNPKKKKNKKLKQEAAQQVPLLFWRPEDEYYHQHCTASFSFAVPTSGSRPGEEGFEPRRCVMLLTPAQISAARTQLEVVVPNIANQ